MLAESELSRSLVQVVIWARVASRPYDGMLRRTKSGTTLAHARASLNAASKAAVVTFTHCKGYMERAMGLEPTTFSLGS